MYETLVMVSDSSAITMDRLHESLCQRLPNFQVQRDGNWFSLVDDTWTITVGLNDAATVLEESQEIAENFAADRADAGVIASCKLRLEIVGDDDFEMDHFNDYLYILEAIDSFGSVFIFDSQGMEWIDFAEGR